jgi:peptidoglycan/xylan/chitin deacetylase (PgdA/CDA1 family)
VLTLHRVVDERERAHDVRRESLRWLLDTVAHLSFSTELARPAPGSVVLTFDDATGDHLDLARVLAARGIHAVFFASLADVGRPGHLDQAGLRELADAGHVVGSHAVDHAPLSGLPPHELRREVAESKAGLEQILERPVRFFAPPGGIGHPALGDELERAGYDASRSMRWGFYRARGDRWRVPCLPVTEYTLRSGWIAHAALRGTLPISMRAASVARAVMPDVVTTRIRRRLLVGR